MPRTQSTGTLRLFWLASADGDFSEIDSLAAPTVTEVTSAVEITAFLRRDGLKTPASGNTVDASDVGSLFNKTALGTYGGDAVEVSLYRDSLSGSDTAWPLFERGNYGFLLIYRFGTAGASPAASDRLEVWAVGVTSRAMADIAENEPQYFTASCAVLLEPEDAATLAAGTG